MAAKLIVNQIQIGEWTIASDESSVSLSKDTYDINILNTQREQLQLSAVSEYTVSENNSSYHYLNSNIQINIDIEVSFNSKTAIEIALPYNSVNVQIGSVCISLLSNQSKISTMGVIRINESKNSLTIESDLFDPLYSGSGLRVLGSISYGTM